jgi:SNF2 family DNA or RNA helicase
VASLAAFRSFRTKLGDYPSTARDAPAGVSALHLSPYVWLCLLQPQRKNLRHGWSKLNSFHVVITSYQLVVQDAAVFKRKKVLLFILDAVSWTHVVYQHWSF